MARSPVLSNRRTSGGGTRRPSQFHHERPDARDKRRVQRFQLRYARLLQKSHIFRLGIRYAYKRRLLYPWKIKTKTVYKERVVRGGYFFYIFGIIADSGASHVQNVEI